MTDVDIRPLRSDDLPAIVAINDGAYPAVPITPLDELGALVAHAELALVVERAGATVGFLVAIAPGRDYASENYRFFSERSNDFLYVDRIVLAPDARGAGAGRALYGRVFDAARARGASEVVCEVNVEPPNPESLAFHAALGFREVGRQETKGGSVIVALLAAPVEGA
ncbi:GNAT family N-acetyltransferase [Homoserinibacter sp. GY 40078]|uniref:GNAT family N-acetyltransferase n=1 Tax=Homoserinibacter sp. GY 40078 TaxID=2603275 RepID=UPI0011C78BD5|nr:GNAT family N-acetyltransferase [Homoserinibacter sp. GY 40078]TXK17111.1 GNAT family N-acetyltransferase [Homoserinibacter sp. GY 40078]